MYSYKYFYAKFVQSNFTLLLKHFLPWKTIVLIPQKKKKENQETYYSRNLLPD